MNAFNGCVSITEFTIPFKVTEINGFGLQKIEKLYYSVTLEDWLNAKVTRSVSYTNKIYFKELQGSYYEVLDIVIPSSITSIGNY